MSNTRTAAKKAPAPASEPKKQFNGPVTFTYDDEEFVVDPTPLDDPTAEFGLIVMQMEDGDGKSILLFLKELGIDLRRVPLRELEPFMEALNAAMNAQQEIGLGEGSGSGN